MRTLTATLLGLILSFGMQAQTNLIVNGDFETGDKNPEWLGWNWALQSDDAYEGDFAARTNSNYVGDAAINYVVELEVGKAYDFVAFARAGQADKDFNFRLQYRDTANAWATFWQAVVSDTSWQQYDSMAFVLPAGTQMRINMYQPQGGTFLLDSVSVTEADTATTSREVLSETAVSIFPNPAADQLELKLETNRLLGGTLQLTDLQGRTLLTRTLDQRQLRLETSDLLPGLYLLRLQNGQAGYTQKLMIQR